MLGTNAFTSPRTFNCDCAALSRELTNSRKAMETEPVSRWFGVAVGR